MNNKNIFPLNDLNFLKRILSNYQTDKKKIVTTYKRNTKISKIFIGQKVAIHNGKALKMKTISFLMLQHKLGEFINTRMAHTFKQKKQRKKK